MDWIGISIVETHLGIQRCSDLSNNAAITARITTARRTLYALMGAGLHGLNGTRPVTSLKLIDIYVLPRLLYGPECLVISRSDIQQLEIFYRDTLKKIQHVPDSTATPACYLLLGAMPVEAHLLTLLGAIMRRENSLEYQLCERQLAMKENFPAQPSPTAAANATKGSMEEDHRGVCLSPLAWGTNG